MQVSVPKTNGNGAFPYQDTRTLGSNQVPTLGFTLVALLPQEPTQDNDNVLACHAGVLRTISILETRSGLKNKRNIEIS